MSENGNTKKSPKVTSHLNIKAVVPLAPETSKDDPKDGMKGKKQNASKDVSANIALLVAAGT